MAAEGKYHKYYLTKYNRTTARNALKQGDIAMVLLCNELSHYNNTDKIIKVSEIWDRYCVLAKETGTTIPSSYMSWADPEGGQGVRTPSEKSQKYRVSSQYWSGSTENHKAIKPAFNVGQSSARQRNAI